MEPRSWKWIQAAVIAAAMVVGLAVALWYQNRPATDPLPAPAAMPNRKLVRHPAPPDVTPMIAPLRAGAGGASTPATGAGAGTVDSSVSASVPSQSSAYAAQNTVISPMANLRVTPVPVTPLPGTSPVRVLPPVAVQPPVIAQTSVGASPGDSAGGVGANSGVPFAPLPGSPTSVPASAPSALPSSSSVSPFVTTAPPATGASAAPLVTPGP